ncbi:MAG: hypothetical protein AB7I13_05950 [Vicinamibacterales bacterium]
MGESEEWVAPVEAPEYMEDAYDIPIVRLRPAAPPTEEELQQQRAANEERERRYELYSACRDRELRGELPGFSAWANENIIHLSYTPFCAWPSTACGQRIKAKWKTAVGIQDMHRGRVCKRCGWFMARSMAKATGLDEPSSREWFEYRLGREERRARWESVGFCEGSGALVCEPGEYGRRACPGCGHLLIPRGDGRVRKHKVLP